MLGQQTDRLAAIEQDLRSRSVPLADILRACRSLAKEAQAVHLEEWATAELEGYWPLASVPDYRRVSAPIVSTFDVPHRGLVMEFFNLQMVPERFRELLGQPVPLNQSVDELEAVAAQYEARDVPVQLEVIASDLLVVMWNKNNPQGRRLLTMTWAIDPPLIRGVLGRVRTKLTEFIAELRTVIGQSGRLPSAEQADAALLTVLPSAIFNNSNVTTIRGSSREGCPIMEGMGKKPRRRRSFTAEFELLRVFRTGKLRLIHAASCPFKNSSMTSCGVRYPSPEWRRVLL